MTEKIRAAVFGKEAGDIHIEEFDLPDLKPEEVLVKIDACAICTWEQRIYKGINKVELPFVGGHEMAGRIVALGNEVDTDEWSVGDHVALCMIKPCGSCFQCKTGNEQNCVHFGKDRKVRALPYKGIGGLSTYFIATIKNLFRYENTVPPEEAAFSEPLSCVIHSIESADIRLGDTVLVVGCGIMGMFHMLLAQRKGARVIVADPNEERMKLALKLGASFAVNPQKENLKERVKEITGGIMAQEVFHTIPIADAVPVSIGCLSNKGKLVLYSSFHPDKPVSFDPGWLHSSGACIMGTANSNSRDFTEATRLIAGGIVDVKPFISEVYPFEKVKDAFESACKGDKFRVIVKF